MKGVSAVIATIMMLVMTIALAGMAYMFISGAFTAQTGRIMELEAGAVTCTGATRNITVYIKNIGSIDYYTNETSVGLAGATLSACDSTAAAQIVTAGSAPVKCGIQLLGSPGPNTVVVVGSGKLGPTNSVRGTVYC
jgi:flagellin-like protein